MPSEEIEEHKRTKKDVALGVWIVVFTVIVVASLVANRIQNNNRIDDLRKSRDAIVYAGCVDTNLRHDNTIKALDKRFKELAKTAAAEEKQQLKDSRDFTVALIDALAPKRDCVKLVQRRVNAPDVPVKTSTTAP